MNEAAHEQADCDLTFEVLDPTGAILPASRRLSIHRSRGRPHLHPDHQAPQPNPSGPDNSGKHLYSRSCTIPTLRRQATRIDQETYPLRHSAHHRVRRRQRLPPQRRARQALNHWRLHPRRLRLRRHRRPRARLGAPPRTPPARWAATPSASGHNPPCARAARPDVRPQWASSSWTRRFDREWRDGKGSRSAATATRNTSTSGRSAT